MAKTKRDTEKFRAPMGVVTDEKEMTTIEAHLKKLLHTDFEKKDIKKKS